MPSDTEHLLREIYHIVHHEAHAWAMWRERDRDRNRPLSPEDLEILDALLARTARLVFRLSRIGRDHSMTLWPASSRPE